MKVIAIPFVITARIGCKPGSFAKNGKILFFNNKIVNLVYGHLGPVIAAWLWYRQSLWCLPCLPCPRGVTEESLWSQYGVIEY